MKAIPIATLVEFPGTRPFTAGELWKNFIRLSSEISHRRRDIRLTSKTQKVRRKKRPQSLGIADVDASEDAMNPIIYGRRLLRCPWRRQLCSAPCRRPFPAPSASVLVSPVTLAECFLHCAFSSLFFSNGCTGDTISSMTLNRFHQWQRRRLHEASRARGGCSLRTCS